MKIPQSPPAFDEPPSSGTRSRRAQRALERREALNQSPHETLPFHTSRLPLPLQTGSSPDNPIVIDDENPEREAVRPTSSSEITWFPGYRRRAANTTEYERNQCRTLHHHGQLTVPAIACTLNLTIAQVRYALIVRDPTQPRGRPRTVPRDIVDLLFSLINTPRKTKRTMTYETARNLHPLLLPFSGKALRNAMLAAGYRRMVQPACFPLPPHIRQARLAFALRWSHLLDIDWSHWVWTDETWSNGLSACRKFVTIGPGEDVREFSKAKFKPNGWMFWGCFAGDKKGPSVIWEKKWGKINSESYQLRILPKLKAFWRSNDSFVIQQDNAPAHKSRSTKIYFDEHFPNAHIAEWPAHSPDLNPIEHVWAFMKRWIDEQPGERPTGKNLVAAISSAWEAVSPNMLTHLYSSMPRRMAAVIAANGGWIGM